MDDILDKDTPRTESTSPSRPSSPALMSLSVSGELQGCYLQDVEIGKEIGAGAFGTVYEGRWHGARVAVKALTNHDFQELSREALTMKKLSHPNIVQFLGVYNNPNEPTLVYMVTEFVEGGNLETMLRSNPGFFKFEDLIRLTMEVASGMRLLEQKGIIHRDLAARNILIDASKQEFTAKVSDFGMSRDTEDYYTAKNSAMVPVKWAAPEVLRFNKYSTSSDVWAMGITLWEIFTYGEIPYAGMTNKEAAEWVKDGNRMAIPKSIDLRIKDLIFSCWAEDPKDRPSFKQIYDHLEKITAPQNRAKSNSANSTSQVYAYTTASVLGDPEYGTPPAPLPYSVIDNPISPPANEYAETKSSRDSGESNSGISECGAAPNEDYSTI